MITALKKSAKVKRVVHTIFGGSVEKETKQRENDAYMFIAVPSSDTQFPYLPNNGERNTNKEACLSVR